MIHIRTVAALFLAAFALVPVAIADETVQPPKIEEAGQNRIWQGGFWTVVDGDTLFFNPGDPTEKRVRMRLFGIDAPEGRDWPHGPYASETLWQMVRRAGVAMVCEQVDTDKYKRPVVVCYNPERAIKPVWNGDKSYATLNGAMLSTGWVSIYHYFFWPDPGRPKDWLDRMAQLVPGMFEAQQDAVQHRRGIWAGFSLK